MGRPRLYYDWYVNGRGYLAMFDKDHPCANASGFVLQHVAIASAAFGRRLPKGVVVHHVNGIKTDNRKANLLVCDATYHALLHARMRALAACGNPDWRRCPFCDTWDDRRNLIHLGPKSFTHRACHRAYEYQRKRPVRCADLTSTEKAS